MTWLVPLDAWDGLDDNVKGRMMATYRMTRLMSAWESYIQQPG